MYYTEFHWKEFRLSGFVFPAVRFHRCDTQLRDEFEYRSVAGGAADYGGAVEVARLVHDQTAVGACAIGRVREATVPEPEEPPIRVAARSLCRSYPA